MLFMCQRTQYTEVKICLCLARKKNKDKWAAHYMESFQIEGNEKVELFPNWSRIWYQTGPKLYRSQRGHHCLHAAVITNRTSVYTWAADPLQTRSKTMPAMCVFVWVLPVGRRSSTADVRCQKYCVFWICVWGAGVAMSRELLACVYGHIQGVSSLHVFA